MSECETFIRGTFRFKGFSAIISAFHDVGLTCDDVVPAGVATLRELSAWRFTKVPELAHDNAALVDASCAQLTGNDQKLAKALLNRVDTRYLNGDMKRV